MGRSVKRVPIDFNWPMKKIWPGYMICITSIMETYYPEEGDDLTEIFAKIMKCKYEDASDLTSIDPPTGDGWQMWEDTSEGSPMSPVFKTPEELARWLSNNEASAFGNQTATYKQWLEMINEGWAPCGVYTPETGLISGVQATQLKEGS